jgi:hypothetical protein
LSERNAIWHLVYSYKVNEIYGSPIMLYTANSYVDYTTVLRYLTTNSEIALCSKQEP